MDFIYIVVFIVLIAVLSKSRKEINALRNQVNFLDGKIRDLYDKAYYNYEQIKSLKNEDAEAVNEPEHTAEAPVENIPIHNQVLNTQTQNPEYQFNPYRKNNPHVNVNVSHDKAVRKQDIPPVHNPVLPNVQMQQSYNIPQKEYSNTETSSVQINRAVPPQNLQVNNSAPKKKSDNPKQLKSFENWLGTRLFNVVASLMIFIGLVLFCTLGYEYITDTMKMAAMFIVSGGFIALGAFFTRQNKSVFSLGLTGCGFGAFFISILLSHVYFNALADVAAFGLLLLWAMLALYMSKKLDSVMLSVTAHMGTAVSICFAFSFGFSADKIILPVAYQIAAIAVIIMGNIFCCKKTYRFGLFMSMILMIYTSIVMCAAFESSSVMPGRVSPIFTSVIFVIQFIAISFISYLITISTAALETEKAELKNLEEIILFAHSSNKVLWTTGVVTTVGVVTSSILRNVFDIDSLVIPTLAVCAAAVGHILVTLFMSEKLNFNENLSIISIWFNSVLIMLALFAQSSAREFLHGVPFLFVYIGFIMIIIRYTKNKRLNHLAAFLIGCEMLYMTLYGYFAAANVVISIIYMVIIGLMVLLHWFMQSGESRERRFTFFKMAEYLWLSVSIIPINVSEFSDISFPLILSEFALMNIITYLCRYGRDNEPELKIAVKIESLLTAYISIIALMFNEVGSLGDILAIKIVFVILSAALTGLYIKDFALSKSTALQVLSALTTSAFITTFFIGFSDTLGAADIYVDVLRCKPFFFIAAVMLALIYYFNKNHELQGIMWPILGIDAFLMLFFGYGDLLSEYDYDVLLHIISIIVCAAHAVIDGLLLYYTWKLQNEKQQSDTLTLVKAIEYFWINFSIFAVCQGIQIDTFLIIDLTFAVLLLVNIILFIIEYNKSSKALDRIIKISANILLYICIMFMATKITSSSEMTSYFVVRYTVRIALILLSSGLYYLISRELLKSRYVIIQAYVGFTATLIVNAACQGFSTIFEIQYIFSIVTMVTALICIVAGFITKTKGLRVYGLIVVMLCVIKLVTFDIGEADSMSRVVAFVVGGIVCFVISGIYNKVESKLLNDEKVLNSAENNNAD